MGSDLGRVFGTSGIVLTNQKVMFGATFTTSSNSLVDITGFSITLPTRIKGICQANFFIDYASSASSTIGIAIVDNGIVGEIGQSVLGVNSHFTFTKNIISQLNGQILKGQIQTSGGNVSVYGTISGGPSVITTLEISP